MADEVVEEVIAPETPLVEPAKQEELPLAAAEETPEEKPAVEAEAPKTEETPPVEEPKPDWRDKELKAKHRQLQEARRIQAEKDAKIAALEALAAKFNQPTGETPAVVPVDEVDRRAKEIVAQNQYVEACNKTAQDGEATYKEQWKDAVANLELLGGFDQATMSGLLATDAPEKVIYELGKNPDNYHRIMALPTEKRIIEMAKIAMTAPSKPVSSAPAPVNPVGGRAAPAAQTLTDNLDDDKWYAIRSAQRRKRWEEKNGVRR